MEKQPVKEDHDDLILIVEDEILLAEDLVLTLKDMGYENCERVSTGEAALSKVLLGNVGLVLMDIKLDGQIDGIEVAEQIGDIADVPIIYLTAFSDECVLKRVKETMPQGYILKPYREYELKAIIEITLHRKRMKQQSRASKQSLQQGGIEKPTLDHLLPLCSHCKRIRKQDDAWEMIEAYIESHLAIRCSHSICPECARKFYPDYKLYE